MDIALRILEVLEDLAWSKGRLAKELSISPQQVSKYAKAEGNFKLAIWCKLEKVRGVELLTLLNDDEVVVQKEVWKYVGTTAKVVNIKPNKFS